MKKLSWALVLGLVAVGCGGGGGGGESEEVASSIQGGSLNLSGKVAFFANERQDMPDYDGYDAFMQIITCRIPELNLTLEVMRRSARDTSYSFQTDPDPIMIYPITRGNRLFVARVDTKARSVTYNEYRYDPAERAFKLSLTNTTLPSAQTTTTVSLSGSSELTLNQGSNSQPISYVSATGIRDVRIDEHDGTIMVCINENYSTDYTTYFNMARVTILQGTWNNPFVVVIPSHITTALNWQVMTMP